MNNLKLAITITTQPEVHARYEGMLIYRRSMCKHLNIGIEIATYKKEG